MDEDIFDTFWLILDTIKNHIHQVMNAAG